MLTLTHPGTSMRFIIVILTNYFLYRLFIVNTLLTVYSNFCLSNSLEKVNCQYKSKLWLFTFLSPSKSARLYCIRCPRCAAMSVAQMAAASLLLAMATASLLLAIYILYFFSSVKLILSFSIAWTIITELLSDHVYKTNIHKRFTSTKS